MVSLGNNKGELDFTRLILERSEEAEHFSRMSTRPKNDENLKFFYSFARGFENRPISSNSNEMNYPENEEDEGKKNRYDRQRIHIFFCLSHSTELY